LFFEPRKDRGINELKPQLSFFFDDWIRIYHSVPSANLEKHFHGYLAKLNAHGLFQGEETPFIFFTICMDISVQNYMNEIVKGEQTALGAFHSVDAFARLIALFIKSMDSGSDKVRQVHKIASMVTLVLAKWHEDSVNPFEQAPFYRFYAGLYVHLTSFEHQLGASYMSIIEKLANDLRSFGPIIFPKFAYSWMSLISHRSLLPKLLSLRNRQGWTTSRHNILMMLRFVAILLNAPDGYHEPTAMLYEGAIKIILLLLHDFPDFLVSGIPQNYIL
jgi:CCR4-NOT transcription complex subunit 1